MLYAVWFRDEYMYCFGALCSLFLCHFLAHLQPWTYPQTLLSSAAPQWPSYVQGPSRFWTYHEL